MLFYGSPYDIETGVLRLKHFSYDVISPLVTPKGDI